MANKRDAKNIFKHYGKMSHDQLKSESKNIKSHTERMKKIGIHTTPEHAKSINYHLNAKSKALKSAIESTTGFGSGKPK